MKKYRVITDNLDFLGFHKGCKFGTIENSFSIINISDYDKTYITMNTSFSGFSPSYIHAALNLHPGWFQEINESNDCYCLTFEHHSKIQNTYIKGLSLDEISEMFKGSKEVIRIYQTDYNGPWIKMIKRVRFITSNIEPVIDLKEGVLVSVNFFETVGVNAMKAEEWSEVCEGYYPKTSQQEFTKKDMQDFSLWRLVRMTRNAPNSVEEWLKTKKYDN